MSMMKDGISGTLLLMGGRTIHNAEQAMEDGADQVLMHAQNYAPWNDRTGMARYGLATAVYSEGTDICLDLYHTVDYGQWLEVIQNGRFAIIMPTRPSAALVASSGSADGVGVAADVGGRGPGSSPAEHAPSTTTQTNAETSASSAARRRER